MLHSLKQKSLWCSRDLCPDKGKYFWEEMKRPTASVCWRGTLSCSSHYATDGIDSLMATKEETHIPIHPATVLSLHNSVSSLHIHFFSSSHPKAQPSRRELIWIICKNINQIILNILGILAATQISKVFEANFKFRVKRMSACSIDSSSRQGFKKEKKAVKSIFNKSSLFLWFSLLKK